MLKNNKGMGIVEALVAIFIISVALFAILECYRQAVDMSVSARNHNTATYLAQQVLEELKKNDGIAAFGNFVATTSVTSPQTINGITYTITQGDPVDLGDNTIRVTVTISWAEGTLSKSAKFTEYYYFPS
jgi:Tfp pilus assembly protein PilV